MNVISMRIKSLIHTKNNFFLLGVGSVLNIFGVNTNINKIEKKTDSEAIYSDWKAIGSDIRIAMNKFEKDNNIGFNL